MGVCCHSGWCAPPTYLSTRTASLDALVTLLGNLRCVVLVWVVCTRYLSIYSTNHSSDNRPPTRQVHRTLDHCFLQPFSNTVSTQGIKKIKKSATEFCRLQIRNVLHPRPRSEEIGWLEALGCDFQGEIDVSDVGPAEIGTLMSRGSRKSTLA